MKSLIPIRRCLECSGFFWAGLPAIGIIPTYHAAGTRFERKMLTIGFTWVPGWMDHCSKECADAETHRGYLDMPTPEPRSRRCMEDRPHLKD